MPMRILILFSVIALAAALEAKWTPAADGGPARFSKKYRDAAGIDDSKWTNDGGDGGGGFADLLPTTPQGWFTALLALGAIAVLWPRAQAAAANRGGHTLGSAPAAPAYAGNPGLYAQEPAARPASDAAEAARRRQQAAEAAARRQQAAAS